MSSQSDDADSTLGSATGLGLPDVHHLQDENSRLRALLTASRVETEKLTKLLDWNKQTADVVLTKLKEECDLEKSVVLDTMDKLKRLTKELRTMKREMVTFNALQDMFTERCEQYKAEVDGMKERLAEVEADRKDLSRLLNMAIRQKIDLRLKLEDLELDKEISQMRRGRRPGSSRSAIVPPDAKFDSHTFMRDGCCNVM